VGNGLEIWLQVIENNIFTHAIKQFDKETLNLYSKQGFAGKKAGRAKARHEH
jgi:hypothetical protein